MVMALLTITSPSAYALTNFGDTIQDAVNLYHYSWGDPSEKEYTLPIDSINDYDYYYIDYANGDASAIGFRVTMTSRWGVVYDLQLIETNQNGGIVNVINYDQDSTEKNIWYSMPNGHRAYIRVSSHGPNDYGQFYTLKFKRII